MLELFLINILFWSVSAQIPEGSESYLDRPEILSLTPTKHKTLGASWDKLKRAHVEIIAQLLELYPDQDLYFLARDSELLFDLATVLTKGEGTRSIHLLNISRVNMRASDVLSYLAQEGLSEDKLKNGKKIVLIDTGFEGTIPKVLQSYFSPQAQKNIQSHFIISENAKIPSSRTFLTAINPAGAYLPPEKMHGTIANYEYIPRYTDRSDSFVLHNGTYHPISSFQTPKDGEISKKISRMYMEDLLYYVRSEEGKKVFEERRKFWHSVLSPNGRQILIDKIKNAPNDHYLQAAARDIIDAQNKNNVLQAQEQLKLEDFGLEAITTAGGNKKLILQIRPD